jgi:hypothetical protein
MEVGPKRDVIAGLSLETNKDAKGTGHTTQEKQGILLFFFIFVCCHEYFYRKSGRHIYVTLKRVYLLSSQVFCNLELLHHLPYLYIVS